MILPKNIDELHAESANAGFDDLTIEELDEILDEAQQTLWKLEESNVNKQHSEKNAPSQY